VVDDSGSVVKLVIPSLEPDAGTYLPVYSGHGDAVNLSRQNADGSLTLANSYRYESWGRPTTATHNGVGDLGFRFLYVGEFDVQWDDQLGLGLLYMHARHYSPSLGRFLQPDPDRSEANLYAYAANNPLTELDPDGTCFILCVIIVGALLFGSLEAGAEVTRYAIHTPQRRWSADGAGRAAREGFVSGAIAGAIPGVGRAVGRPLAKAFGKLITRVPRATRLVRTAPARVHTSARQMVERARAKLRTVEWRGRELRFDQNFRIKPFPSRGRTWPERLPHYHRRVPIPATPGEAYPGQGIGRHRPWQSSRADKHWWDRL